MADLAGIDGKRVRALLESENVRFISERPKSTALLERARESMPRGVPMSWMDGPTVSVAHDESQVDSCVELFGEFLSAVT